MKILIIGTPRSGTTIFFRSLYQTFNLTFFGEPWNTGIHEKIYDYPLTNKSHYITKCLADQVPEGYYDPVKFYSEYVKEFDNVFLLKRTNKDEVIESYTYNAVNRPEGNWHEGYYLADFTEQERIDLKNKFAAEISNIENIYSYIDKISQVTNIPITLYEDLYSGDPDTVNSILKRGNLTLTYKDLESYLNPIHRYRRYKKSVI